MNLLMRSLMIVWCVWIVTGCLSDNGELELNEENLQGAWEITSALRDGQPTETLQGGYFTFHQSFLRTNIFGTEEESEFSIQKRIIAHETSFGPMQYEVRTFNDTLLELQTEVDGWYLELDCRKSIK